MCGHDENLIGASLLQGLCGRKETVHVINDVILTRETKDVIRGVGADLICLPLGDLQPYRLQLSS